MTYQIRQGKKIISYRDARIKKHYMTNPEERSNLLFQIISQNPEIPHTHLLKIALHYGESNAKKTYENLLNDLEKKGLLHSIKKGNSPNSPRLWEIPIPEFPKEKRYKKQVKELIDEFFNQVKVLKESFPFMSKSDQSAALVYLLQSVSTSQSLNRYFSVVTNLETELKQLQKLEDELLFLSIEADFSMVLKLIGKQAEISANNFRKTLDKYIQLK